MPNSPSPTSAAKRKKKNWERFSDKQSVALQSADLLGLKLEKGMTVAVNLDFSARSYPDKNGEIRFENQVRITNIAPFEL